MASTPVLPQTPKLGLNNFVEGTDAAGTYKTIYTAGASGSKIVSVTATNDDSVSHLMTLSVTRSGVDYVIGAALCQAVAGTGGNSPLDLFAGASSGNTPIALPKDNDGQRYILLQSGDTLRATFATVLTSGKRLSVAANGADF